MKGRGGEVGGVVLSLHIRPFQMHVGEFRHCNILFVCRVLRIPQRNLESNVRSGSCTEQQANFIVILRHITKENGFTVSSGTS